jgi:HD-like signal output (HDOD) protein
MGLARWLEPLTRIWRADGAGAAAPMPRPASTPASASFPPAAPGAAGQAPTAAPAPAETAPPVAAVEIPTPARNVRFFRWMIGIPAGAADRPPPDAIVEQMFFQLDEVIASESARAGLLPRAPHVVPQLMKTLRDEGYSSADVADRISKDVVLTAEVVRSATRILQREDDDGDIDLGRAVAVVGTQGLRRAIANVVLRPIFDARGDSLSARAATQIWKDADRKARLGAAIAGEAGLDPFDGYLAGLLHNSGWTAALRAIDLQDLGIDAIDLAHPEVVPQLVRRRDALFGALVGPWNLGAAIEGLAAEVGSAGLEGVASPLGIALRDADRLAALRALAAPGQRPASVVPGWATVPKAVRECFAGMGAA